MKQWKINSGHSATEYDAAVVKYWLHGVLSTMGERFPELEGFLASALADDHEHLAMAIVQGRRVCAEMGEKSWQMEAVPPPEPK